MSGESSARQPRPVSVIFLPSRPQVDTVLAVFVLRKFGEGVFPGVGQAAIQLLPAAKKSEDAGELLLHRVDLRRE